MTPELTMDAIPREVEAPAPKPRRMPVLLMGDILHGPLRDPMLLWHWREAKDPDRHAE